MCQWLSLHLCPAVPARKVIEGADGYLEPNITKNIGLVVHSVTAVKEGVTVARVLNPTGNTVALKQGLHLGMLYALTPTEVGPSLCLSSKLMFFLEDFPFTEKQRAQLSALLGRFCSLFCLSDRDLGHCQTSCSH